MLPQSFRKKVLLQNKNAWVALCFIQNKSSEKLLIFIHGNLVLILNFITLYTS